MEEAQRAEGPSLRSRQGSVEEQMSHLKPDLVRMSREKVLRHYDILGRRYHLSQVTEEHMAPLKNLNLSPTVNNTLLGGEGFPGGSDDKESTCNAGDPIHPWIGKIPWRREWQPALVLPGESHGQRSLVGYSPWG